MRHSLKFADREVTTELPAAKWWAICMSGVARKCLREQDRRCAQRGGETSTRRRASIGQWEMAFEEADVELPEPLEDLHLDLQTGEIEDAPAAPGRPELCFGSD